MTIEKFLKSAKKKLRKNIKIRDAYNQPSRKESNFGMK